MKQPTLRWKVYLPVGRRLRFLRPTSAVSAIEARCNVWWTDVMPGYRPDGMEEAKQVLRNMVARLAIQRKPRTHRAKPRRHDRRQAVLFFQH